MDRHVVAHGDGFGVPVVYGAGKVEPLFDVGRKGGAPKDNAHFVGDGEKDVPKNFEFEVESAHEV